MLLTIPKKGIRIMRVLNLVILLDLIFGGSGRLIMFGSLSFRTLLFGLVGLYTIFYMLAHRVRIDINIGLMLGLFIIYLILNTIIIGDKPIAIKFDFLSRYLYIFMALFYMLYFMKYRGYNDIAYFRSLFEKLTFLFAVFSILLWVYAFRLGASAYSVIEYGFFRPKVYGSFAILGGGIPRVFMKSSIFVPIGLIFQLDKLVDSPSTTKAMKVFIYALAVLTTFTTGFFIATGICVILLLHKKRLLSKRISILIIAAILVGGFVAFRMGIINLMIDRFSSADYSSTYRFTQIDSIIREFMAKPFFGHGFGHEFTTEYGNTIRTTANFEVAWGELLVDTGIIGFLLFVMIIFSVLIKLFRRSVNSKTAYVFALGLLLICLESFTNPFINNSIGLTYFGICVGINKVVKRDNIVLQYMG